MKLLFSIGVVCFVCALAPMLARSASPAGVNFDSFFAQFKSAVARNDAKAVTKLTPLPFLYDSKPRRGTEFQKIYPELFDAKVRVCFAVAKASREDDARVINCGRYIFYFRIVNRQYRFIEFVADPEAAS